MSRTAALSAASAGAALEATTIERRELRDDDIVIDIAFAGICHSDIHQVREEWGSAIFPMVPGHEIAGVVSEVGDGVTRYQVGDRVGVGCMVDSCGECEYCKDGEEQFCLKGAVMTYNGEGYDGEKTMGGYSQQVVVSERFALRIPDGLELDVAAPLLCAGITTFNPLKRWGAGPGKKVAVVGPRRPRPPRCQVRCRPRRRGDRPQPDHLQGGRQHQVRCRRALRHQGRRRPSRSCAVRSTSSSTR